MRATTSTALMAALAGSASAHMMLSFPAPLNSKYNQFADSGKIDYSYTAPLAADGSDYPCKGYQSDLGTPAGQSVASFAVGGQGNITVVGGAAHGGGSCQISLSTDGAKTFKVIQSIIGNCPTNGEGNFDFTVPSDAPAGDAVLAWSWNNRIGNREFYMNCAAVTLTGGSAKREATDKRAASFSSLPDMFVANIGNGCSVAEGGDVDYPNPGEAVTKNSDNPEAPSGSCGSSGSSSGSGSSDSGAAASPSSSAVAEVTASLPVYVPPFQPTSSSCLLHRSHMLTRIRTVAVVSSQPCLPPSRSLLQPRLPPPSQPSPALPRHQLQRPQSLRLPPLLPATLDQPLQALRAQLRASGTVLAVPPSSAALRACGVPSRASLLEPRARLASQPT